MSGPPAHAYFRKAEAALKAARLLLLAKDADGACNRAYYAMFDAAHGALFAVGAEGVVSPIKTHNGLLAKFGQSIVASGQLAAEFGGDLNKVQTLRQLADYSGDPVAMERATWAVERAEAFVVAVRARFSSASGSADEGDASA